MAVGEGGDRRHLGDQPVRLEHALLRFADRFSGRVEGAERGDRGVQHPHWVGIVMEAVHELPGVLVQVRCGE